MVDAEQKCEICGGAVRVRILEGYAEGRPVVRCFCLACADLYDRFGTGGRGGQTGRLGLAWLAVVGGLLIVAVGLCGDYLGITGSSGFGWYQRAGAIGGALLLTIGALSGVEILVVAGGLVLALAVSADMLGLSGREGIGWKQGTAILSGLLIAGAGFWFKVRGAAARADGK